MTGIRHRGTEEEQGCCWEREDSGERERERERIAEREREQYYVHTERREGRREEKKGNAQFIAWESSKDRRPMAGPAS